MDEISPSSEDSENKPGPSTRFISSLDPPTPFTMQGDHKNINAGLKSCIILRRLRNSLPVLSKRQWQLLAVFAAADFIAGIVYNIKGPFYPQEAEKKGVTATEYGFVFGIFDLTKVFACPIIGKYMAVLGPKKVFIFSMMLISLCSIGFGMLDKIDSPTGFLAMSLIIRVFEAFGSAGFSTATFSIIACEFPNTVATTFASLETFFGLGLIVGPLLGGLFFQIGGYNAPFIVTGFLFFTAALVIMSTMPQYSTADDETNVLKKFRRNSSSRRASEQGFSVFTVLKIPGVMLAAFGVWAAASSAGFINATLEPHIRQFKLTPVQVGIVFVIYGTIYALTAPIWGWICDRMSQPKFITLAGGVLNLLAFLLIGPAPFVAFDSILWVTCAGLVLHGLALGATFVSGFVLSLRYSIASGLPNNMATYGIVSGMWTSALSLGMFCGPVVGGVLLEHVGFRWGSVYVLVSMLILIILIVMFLLVNGIHIRCLDSIVPEAERPLLIKGRGRNKSVTFYHSSDDTSSEGHVFSYGSSTA